MTAPPPPDPRPGPVLALVGPTAAGKTELALAVAERLGAEVVSADAMLVYRGMDIGTAKPTPEDRRRVPHHLVDLVDPGEEFSVARFQPLARAAIADVLGRGRPPLLVGGSGLYFQAVVDDFVFPPTDQAVRARLEAEAARVGLPELYRRLAAADPPAAARIQPELARQHDLLDPDPPCPLYAGQGPERRADFGYHECANTVAVARRVIPVMTSRQRPTV